MNDDELAAWSAEQGRRFQRWSDGGRLIEPGEEDVHVPAEVHFRRADELTPRPTPMARRGPAAHVDEMAARGEGVP